MKFSSKLGAIVLATYISISVFSIPVHAKDPTKLEQEAREQQYKANNLQEKIEQDRSKANEAIDKGKKDRAAKYARKAAKTEKLVQQREKMAAKLNKEAVKKEQKKYTN